MSSHDMKNPTGGVHMGHVMESPDPNGRLLERILSRENMLKAWKRVKANKGAPGIDKMSIEEFPELARNNWDSIRESLLAGTYQPLPVKRVEIPKPTGGTRPLGIPTVLDRMIQQAIYQVLMPIFDPDFSDYSYGFRRADRHMTQSSKCVSISGRVIALQWTWICQNSLTRLITMS